LSSLGHNVGHKDARRGFKLQSNHEVLGQEAQD
jgi:hypothetical protein